MTTLTVRDIEELREHFDKVVDNIQDNAIEDAETEIFALYWANRLSLEIDARQGNAHSLWQETGETIPVGTFVRSEVGVA